METREAFENIPCVKNWLNGVAKGGNGSKNTRRLYLGNLYNMCKIFMTPDQMLAEARSDIDSFEAKLSQWYADNEDAPRTSRWSKWMTLMSFLLYNKVILSKTGRQVQKPVAADREIISKVDLKKFVDGCGKNYRLKSFVLCGRDSGLAPNDLLQLTYVQIKKDYEAGVIPITIHLVRGKSKIKTNTFFGRESIAALKDYLNSRTHNGEKLTDDSPLFKSGKNGNSPAYETLRDQVFRIGRDTNIEFRLYDTRSYFYSHLTSDGASVNLVESWMGHSLGIRRHYEKTSIEDQRRIYLEHYNSIAFAELVDRQQMQQEAYEAALEKLSKKHGLPREDIDSIMAEMDKYRKQIASLTSVVNELKHSKKKRPFKIKRPK